ncbi:MAG: prepilin peptidase, partial [Planctomycetaceae bacterium]|nr:prepilin peptidase [Planctomycetaceae bacterium]
ITVFGVVMSAAIARVHLVPVWYQSATLERDFGILLGEEWRHLLDLPAGAVVDGPIWVPAWITAHPHVHGLVVSLAGAFMGYALIKLVRELGNRVLHRESMGIGDIYLMIAIGAFLGWQATIVAFFVAPVWGLLFAVGQRFIYRDDYIPYGPFLSLGALVTLLFWSSIFERTHRIFELGVILIPMFVCMVVLFILSLLMVQGAKWMLGLSLDLEPEFEGEFGPADQTSFFAGEFVNRWSGRWKMQDWEGNSAGRGQVHEERWRNGRDKPLGPPRRDLRDS